MSAKYNEILKLLVVLFFPPSSLKQSSYGASSHEMVSIYLDSKTKPSKFNNDSLVKHGGVNSHVYLSYFPRSH